MRNKTRKLLLLSTALSAAVLGWRSGLAHHAFSAFDRDQRQVISGKVDRFAWTNPHVWLYVMVPDENGADIEWGLEGPAIRTMTEHGWTRNSVKNGDPVSLVIHPRKDGEPGGHMVTAKLADGQILEIRGPAPELESIGEDAIE